MWAKLRNYGAKRLIQFKKEQYLKQLSEFDHPLVTIEHVPVMLVAFWKGFDPTLLSTITAREWMYITTVVRHSNIAELIYAVQDFTNAVAQDDYGTIELAAKERFRIASVIDMDTYIVGINGEAIDPIEAITALKNNLSRHGDIIDTVPGLAYRRFLNSFYNDILSLTVTLVNNIKV